MIHFEHTENRVDMVKRDRLRSPRAFEMFSVGVWTVAVAFKPTLMDNMSRNELCTDRLV